MDANKIRTAWLDRKENKYDYGSWHSRENLSQLQKWVSIQNTTYTYVFYWIEDLDNDVVINLVIKNTEKGSTRTPELTTDLTTDLTIDNVFIRDFIILPL